MALFAFYFESFSSREIENSIGPERREFVFVALSKFILLLFSRCHFENWLFLRNIEKDSNRLKQLD